MGYMRTDFQKSNHCFQIRDKTVNNNISMAFLTHLKHILYTRKCYKRIVCLKFQTSLEMAISTINYGRNYIDITENTMDSFNGFPSLN